MLEDRRRRSTLDEMKKAFAVFDADGDGYINGGDIKRTMESLGERMSESDVISMVNEADTDGDGRINFRGTHS